ncbi:MAG: D-alanine--D-alanine ligase [Spongiibacteraceae bacterium]
MGDMTSQEINQATGGKLAVLLGGKSAEREISLQSGAAICAALTRMGIRFEAIDVADEDCFTRIADGVTHAFIALHGPGGEDGTVQGALECLGVSYTGSGVMASALAMDKLRSKLLWRGSDMPTPGFVELTAASNWQSLVDDFQQLIVKPSCEGSSIGMARAASAESLQQAWESARVYGKVLAEQWVTGEEYTVAVLAGEPLPPIKLETDAEFYDFDAKYLSNQTRYICPCGLDIEREQALKNLALQAFNSLGCSGWGRVDVMRDESGEFHLLEVNTVPGMTDHSLVPMAAKQGGLGFDDLVKQILVDSLRGDET